MIRVALYDKKPKTLKIKFEYDQITVGKIKKIPGRTYEQYDGKIWTIPYRHIGKLTEMFDESEMIIEEGVDLNYIENDKYDFSKEINLLKNDKFKKTVRYILNQTKDSVDYQDKTKHIINAIKLAHVMSEHKELTDIEHDIVLTALIVKDFCSNDNILKDNYESLSTDVKYVYNMFWSTIEKCIKTHNTEFSKAKTKLQKVVNECAYLASYVTNGME